MTILKILAAIIGIGVIGFSLTDSPSQSTESSFAPTMPASAYQGYSGHEYYGAYDDVTDKAYDNWSDVRDYMSGTETIEACSDSGCYDLDADISDGNIDTVYFPNGGYIHGLDASIDSDGNASGYDQNGRYWEFNIDTGSGVVEDAISDWSSDYEYLYEE